MYETIGRAQGTDYFRIAGGVTVTRFDSFNVTGIDNINFSANTPTPGAMALLGLGGLVATRRRRA